MKKETQFISIRPGDLVVVGHRQWRVTGVYLGASEQENAVGLETVGMSMPCVPDPRGGLSVPKEMFVPIALIEPRAVFRMVDHDAERMPKLATV